MAYSDDYLRRIGCLAPVEVLQQVAPIEVLHPVEEPEDEPDEEPEEPPDEEPEEPPDEEPEPEDEPEGEPEVTPEERKRFANSPDAPPYAHALDQIAIMRCSPATKYVAAAIACTLGADGGRVATFQSVNGLAKLAGVSRNSVIRAIRTLRQMGPYDIEVGGRVRDINTCSLVFVLRGVVPNRH
jgi:hypothetical protein